MDLSGSRDTISVSGKSLPARSSSGVRVSGKRIIVPFIRESSLSLFWRRVSGFGRVEVLDEDHLVALLAEDHFVHQVLRPQQAVASCAHPLLLPYLQVLERIFGMGHC